MSCMPSTQIILFAAIDKILVEDGKRNSFSWASSD